RRLSSVLRGSAAAIGTSPAGGLFRFAFEPTSTAVNTTHLPSGEGTGSFTRLSAIMSSKVKGCLLCADASEQISKHGRSVKTTNARRISASQKWGKFSRQKVGALSIQQSAFSQRAVEIWRPGNCLRLRPSEIYVQLQW